jgi:D-arabinonate dehydratase
MYEGIWRLGRRGLGLQCLGAIDSALWDIKGKALGVPVSTLFGGHRERVPTYANAAHQLPPDKLAEKCLEYVRQGHSAVKIRGSATAVSLHEAADRVRLVREAIGPDVRLMVDVNGTWDADTAIRMLKAWEPYDIYWLEEPVHPEDIPGYVAVRKRAGRTLIAGGEQHATMFEFRELIRQGAVDVVQPNVNVTGGITEWLRIHALATALNVPVSPWDLQHIHLHMAAGLPNVQWIEYFTPDRDELAGKLFKSPVMREVRGEDAVYLLPPDDAGLGIEIDEAEAAKYEIRA